LRRIPEIQDLKVSAKDLQADPSLFGEIEGERDLYRKVAVAAARVDASCFAEYVHEQVQHPFHDLLHWLRKHNPRLCVDAPVEHGKTTQFDIIAVEHELGLNPSHQIGLFSNSGAIPARAVRAVRDTLESNERYHEVFPHVELIKSTGEQLYLRRPAGLGAIHPSLIGIGIQGSIIGSRLSIIILDDILDFQNTWSENERAKLWELLQSTVLNRLLANGSLWDIGTPWHVEDARHKLRRLPGYAYAHFDAEDGLYYRLNGKRRPIPDGNEIGLWGSVYVDPISGNTFGFPPERLAEKKRQMPVREYMRQFRCVALAGALEIFSPAAMEYSKSLGRQYYFPLRWFKEEEFDRGKVRCTWRPAEDPKDPIITGVDLAISKKETAHSTAFYTGTPKGGRRILLEIRAGQMELAEIARHVIRIVRRYPNHRGFRVENNQAQDYLVQVLNNADLMRALGATEIDLQRLSVRAHTTTATNKLDPVTGIRGMALAFEQGRWPIPADESDFCPGLVGEWYDGLVAFDPTSHPNDIVMASWLFAEECRVYGEGASTGTWGRWGMFVPKG